MSNPRIVAALTVANLVLLVVTIALHLGPAFADAGASVLRGRGLEIVDAQGRIRASLQVLPASTNASGEVHAETVLLRLITERGRPSVKIGASEQAAGLSFAGPTGTKDTYAILEAKGTATSLKLRDESGQEHVTKP